MPGELAGLAAQDVAPEVVGIAAEDVERLRRYDVPAALLDLTHQLFGAPAGVAGEDSHPVETAVDQLHRRVKVDDAELAEDLTEADGRVETR